MSLEDLKGRLPSYAKDMKINLGNWLNKDQYPELSAKQMFGTALACAEAVGNKDLVDLVLNEGKEELLDEDVHGARAAASIMAMNNVYYKAISLIEDPEISRMPAKLRMTVIGSPGIPKADFELYCLAVSAINGCGMCLKSHAAELVRQEVAKEAIHSALRIAAIATASSYALSKA